MTGATARVRVGLPPHLRTLAGTGATVELDVVAPVTQRTVLDALEDRYPMLGGTIRDRETKLRRPLLRFFACEQDLSDEPIDAPLPPEVTSGKEPYFVVGAMSGGRA